MRPSARERKLDRPAEVDSSGYALRCAAESSVVSTFSLKKRLMQAIASLDQTVGPILAMSIQALVVFACASRHGSDPGIGHHGPAAPASAIATEIKQRVAETHAVYLVGFLGCEEWRAEPSEKKIRLSRAWHDLHGDDGLERRFEEVRVVDIVDSAMVLSHTVEYHVERWDPATEKWETVKAVVGGHLCQAEPQAERVMARRHYRIGGADLFFSRRLCEESLGSSGMLGASCR